MYVQKKPDVGGELKAYPFRSGIKLTRPDLTLRCKSLGMVSDLLNISCSVYFETVDGVIQILNERNAEFCGFDSVSHAISKRYFDTLPERTATLLRYNDDVVMQEETAKIFEENILQESGEIKKAISLKLPWYNHDNKIIGLFGMSILMGKDAVAQPLMEMAKLGFLSQRSPENEMNLSRQQTVCANLLLSGMTNKQIAKQLNLSPRTVESYINDLKTKLCCKNKMELIAKLSKCEVI